MDQGTAHHAAQAFSFRVPGSFSILAGHIDRGSRCAQQCFLLENTNALWHFSAFVYFKDATAFHGR